MAGPALRTEVPQVRQAKDAMARWIREHITRGDSVMTPTDRPVTARVQDAILRGAATVANKGLGALGSSEAAPTAPEAFNELLSSLAAISTGPRRGLGSLAAGLMPVRGEVGRYALRPQVLDRLRYFYDLGLKQPQQANWEGATQDLLKAFGEDKALSKRWSRLWGATSPSTDAVTNTRESVAAHLPLLTQPDLQFTNRMAQRLRPVKITMAPSKVPNVNRAILGNPLSGDKVEAMAGYMVGEPRIPIDVHGLYGLGSDATKLSKELPALRALMAEAEGLPKRGGLTKTQLYTRTEQAIADSLRKITPDTSQNQAWGTLWEGIRAGKKLGPQGGPVDMLRGVNLLEPNAMLSEDAIREALQQPWAKWRVR